MFFCLFLNYTATALLCGAIMSDHWEEVSWDKDALMHENTSPSWYLDGRVAKLQPVSASPEHYFANQSAFLVPMHGGIWTMCVSLTGNDQQFWPFKQPHVHTHITTTITIIIILHTVYTTLYYLGGAWHQYNIPLQIFGN